MKRDPHWNLIVNGDRWHVKGKRDYYRLDVDPHKYVKLYHVDTRRREELVKDGTVTQVAPFFKGLARSLKLHPIKRTRTTRQGTWFEIWWN